MSEVYYICKWCFYHHRTNLNFESCSHASSDMVYCVWNSEKGVCETTEQSVRPYPLFAISKYFRCFIMCDPVRFGCGGETCTYCHGDAELHEWNRQLKGGAAAVEPESKKRKFTPIGNCATFTI